MSVETRDWIDKVKTLQKKNAQSEFMQKKKKTQQKSN